VALTPTWSETAFFADYVLPMGHSSERHDVHSYEQYDGQWIGFRQPVLRAARERLGERVRDTREVNPGEVWEENELWIDLSWRIDPDGSLGIRRYYESRERPGEKLGVDEYYAWMFEHSVPGARDGVWKGKIGSRAFQHGPALCTAGWPGSRVVPGTSLETTAASFAI
jgi:anaerobic selenocysteine-containing dehydrogenase